MGEGLSDDELFAGDRVGEALRVDRTVLNFSTNDGEGAALGAGEVSSLEEDLRRRRGDSSELLGVESSL